MGEVVFTGGIIFLYGIIAAKWSMELGFSQFNQILLFLLSLFLGPLVLFVLYLRLLYRRKDAGEPGTQFFGAAQRAK